MNSAARRLVSVVVPVYDSPSLDALTDGIEAVFRTLPDDYEIILVDDDSPDARIWPALERLARERRQVRCLQLTRNFGQQAATLLATSERLVQMASNGVLVVEYRTVTGVSHNLG